MWESLHSFRPPTSRTSILRDNVDSLAIFFVVDHDTIFFTMILNRVLAQNKWQRRGIRYSIENNILLTVTPILKLSSRRESVRKKWLGLAGITQVMPSASLVWYLANSNPFSLNESAGTDIQLEILENLHLYYSKTHKNHSENRASLLKFEKYL